MRCDKGLAYLRQSLRHHGVDNTSIWIADALRCMTGKTEYNAVRTAVQDLPLDAAGRDRFISSLAWVAKSSMPELVRSGARWRAVLLLDVLAAPWDAQRAEVLASIVQESTDCEDLLAAVEHAKTYSTAEELAQMKEALLPRAICKDVLDRF